MRAEIEKYVFSLLTKKAPFPMCADIYPYRYLDKGQVDSMGLIKFIFEIEDRFDIAFSPEDTQSDEFRTVGGLINMIERKTRASTLSGSMDRVS